MWAPFISQKFVSITLFFLSKVFINVKSIPVYLIKVYISHKFRRDIDPLLYI
jgi:hypothetical protein